MTDSLQRTLATAIALLAFLQPFGHGHSHEELAGVELRCHLVLYHCGQPLARTGTGWHYHPVLLSGQCSPSPQAEQTDEIDQPSVSIWNGLESSSLPRRTDYRHRLRVDRGRTHHEMLCVLLI